MSADRWQHPDGALKLPLLTVLILYGLAVPKPEEPLQTQRCKYGSSCHSLGASRGLGTNLVRCTGSKVGPENPRGHREQDAGPCRASRGLVEPPCEEAGVQGGPRGRIRGALIPWEPSRSAQPRQAQAEARQREQGSCPP